MTRNKISRGIRSLARAVRGTPKSARPQVSRPRNRMVEDLEARQYFALLGIFNALEFPALNYGPPGAINYKAPTAGGTEGSFDTTATVFAILTDALNAYNVNSPVDQGVKLSLKLNATDGSFVGGVAGLDLTIDGDVTINGTNYTGRLLEGEVADFGFSTSGNTYDMRIKAVGGLLLNEPAYQGKDIGMRFTREATQGFANPSPLPGGFASDFGGTPKGLVGPIEPDVAYSSISGYTYYDADNDGVFDTGEAPIPGTTVTLTGLNSLGLSVLRTATTDANGFYKFSTLVPGTYTVTENQPAAYIDGKDTAGSLGGTVNNDEIENIALPESVDAINYNFGEILPASIAGFVYYDANNNGIKNVGEAPIEGVDLTLNGVDDIGPVTLTTTTLADGSYFFGNLRPGTYSVTETQPDNYLDGKDIIGSQGGTTGNDFLSNAVLVQNQAGINNNFGELLPSSLAGFVYVDTDNDGIKDVGEAAIPNATVTLTGTDDLGAPVSKTFLTLADGSYLFDDLRPGTYVLTETQPSGFDDGKDTVGTPGGTTTNDKFSNISLAAGVNGVNNNFGELRSANASIAGFVYVDSDDDGIFDNGETPIQNVTITLTGTNDLGQPVSRVTQTLANGSYSFTLLRPGTYTITETQPAAFADGKDTIGTPGGTTANDVFSNILLAAGFNGVNNNFGEKVMPKPTTGKLSGIKYRDLTGNGLTADDTPLAGTTIQLYRDVDGNGLLTSADGSPVSTTVSATTTGAYSFNNLADGKYLVREVVAAGYIRTHPTNLDYYPVTLTGGATVTGLNFANYYKADCSCSLSNIYYIINGVKKVTDLRGNTKPGDTVTAFFTVATGKSATVSLVSYTAPGATFDANTASQQVIYDVATGTFNAGTYSLTVLNPSSYYQVDFVCGTVIDKFGPAGSNIFYTPQGRLLSADNSGSYAPKAGVTALSGFTFIDANNNGRFDFGEKPIANVKIVLTGIATDGSSVSRTVYTDSNGKYIFGDIKAGTYKIQQTQPSGYKSGIALVGTNGGTATQNLFSNVTVAVGNAGTNYNFAERC